MRYAVRYLLVILILMLTGCVTQEEYAEQQAQYLKENYGLTCEKLGIKPDTPEFGNCLVGLYNADLDRRRTLEYRSFSHYPHHF